MNTIVLILLALALIADVETTLLVIKAGGVEDNPIYGRKPTALRLVLAHAAVLAGGLAIWYFYPEPVSALWIAIAAFGGVSIHNFIVWRKMK